MHRRHRDGGAKHQSVTNALEHAVEHKRHGPGLAEAGDQQARDLQHAAQEQHPLVVTPIERPPGKCAQEVHEEGVDAADPRDCGRRG
jgi:hypothetical protein